MGLGQQRRLFWLWPRRCWPSFHLVGENPIFADWTTSSVTDENASLERNKLNICSQEIGTRLNLRHARVPKQLCDQGRESYHRTGLLSASDEFATAFTKQLGL
jgi:hypothetical protein